MGKASRKRSSENKKKAKKAAKATRAALYASYAGMGRRTRKVNEKTGPTPQKGNHVMSQCGNVGCDKCFPQFRCLRANQDPRKQGRKVCISTS